MDILRHLVPLRALPKSMVELHALKVQHGAAGSLVRISPEICEYYQKILGIATTNKKRYCRIPEDPRE